MPGFRRDRSGYDLHRHRRRHDQARDFRRQQPELDGDSAHRRRARHQRHRPETFDAARKRGADEASSREPCGRFAGRKRECRGPRDRLRRGSLQPRSSCPARDDGTHRSRPTGGDLRVHPRPYRGRRAR